MSASLTRRMVARKQRPLSATAILSIAHDVLAALEYAHDLRAADGSWLGLVHRDITPENILIHRERRGEAAGLRHRPDRPATLDDRLDHRPDDTRPDTRRPGDQQRLARRVARGDRRGDRQPGLHVARAGAGTAGGRPVRSVLAGAGAVLLRGPGPAVSAQGRVRTAAAGGRRTGRRRARVSRRPVPAPARHRCPGCWRSTPTHRFQSARELRLALAPHIDGGRAELAAAMEQFFGGRAGGRAGHAWWRPAPICARRCRDRGPALRARRPRRTGASAATSARSDASSWAPSRRRRAPW